MGLRAGEFMLPVTETVVKSPRISQREAIIMRVCCVHS